MSDLPTTAGALGRRPLVIVSNRGPLSFSIGADGELESKRGAGGLVSGLGPLVVDTDAMWIAAAISHGDRKAAEQGTVAAHGFRVRSLALDPAIYRMAYDVVSNATLWFAHHHLFDLARRPRFDMRWREAWDAYRAMNLSFAEVVVREAPTDAVILVQDYHLTLLAPLIAASRRDLRTVHFSHTPFAGPDALGVLPDDVVAVLLEGMAAHHACGFHTARWAGAFGAACDQFIGTRPRTFVSPLGTDPDNIRSVASSPASEAERAWIDERVGDRSLIVRVDRIELSKNLLRGFHAFADLLDRYPDWRERVVFGAFVYPSREGLAEYLAYRQEVETLVAKINADYSTPGWTPILLDTSDNYPRSVAALRRYDALLVNPIRDGLNLVATEGPLVNERDGVLLLSPEAGSWAELGEYATRVNPFDVSGTADALDRVLRRDRAERASTAKLLRERATERTPADWLADQVAAAAAD
jgi:trehalose 6-phosphate synthase